MIRLHNTCIFQYDASVDFSQIMLYYAHNNLPRYADTQPNANSYKKEIAALVYY